MENEEVYLGSSPPVTINATNCHTINVNVQILIEDRLVNILQKWAETADLERSTGGTSSG